MANLVKFVLSISSLHKRGILNLDLYDFLVRKDTDSGFLVYIAEQFEEISEIGFGGLPGSSLQLKSYSWNKLPFSIVFSSFGPQVFGLSSCCARVGG